MTRTISREIERLNEERDHLRILISLENDRPVPDGVSLANMVRELRQLENRIAEAQAKLVF